MDGPHAYDINDRCVTCFKRMTRASSYCKSCEPARKCPIPECTGTVSFPLRAIYCPKHAKQRRERSYMVSHSPGMIE